MEKIKTLTTYTIELERFLSSGLDALAALYKLSCMLLEGLGWIGKEIFLLILGHCVVIYRLSPTKHEYISPSEKRLERSCMTKFPPRLF